MKSTSSAFLNYIRTRMLTGMPVETNKLTGKGMTVSMGPPSSSLRRMRSSAERQAVQQKREVAIAL